MMTDYIDREAIRDALYDADAITARGVVILNHFPATDVVDVKHGSWGLAIGYDLKKRVQCSVGRLMTYKPTMFCPHCGAKMEPPKGEE